MASDYQIDLRVDYPERSSRGWAVLTILLLKLLALIPHYIVLLFLTIAQAVVVLVAQVVVAVRGEYPEGMFRFVTGVLRWSTRVGAFLYSLTDRYPPFKLEADTQYPVDVVIDRPQRSSRVYALFTLLVEVLVIAGAVWFTVWLINSADSFASGTEVTFNDSSANLGLNLASSGPSVLLLRNIAAVPHLIILAALGLVTFVIWIIVQWAILFTGRYPRGMFDLVVGVTRWQTRVTAYTLGLNDRYPPFTFDPSLTAPAVSPVAGGAPSPEVGPNVGWIPTSPGGMPAVEPGVLPPAPPLGSRGPMPPMSGGYVTPPTTGGASVPPPIAPPTVSQGAPPPMPPPPPAQGPPSESDPGVAMQWPEPPPPVPPEEG